jgi:hypothetical protein
MSYKLAESSRKGKKWMMRLPDGRLVHFGAQGYEDYTQHRDKKRRLAYIARHRKREEWGRAGFDTPGFWARWLLWNEPTLNEAIRSTENMFGLSITRLRSP